jgi:beta-lactamase superfamily II metal-dependent hydrolase
MGNADLWHNVLIDGGFVKTYKQILKPELEKIRARGENIDLAIATHYDSDHIGGLIQFVNDNTFNSEFVRQWWLNCDLPLVDPEGAIGIDQLLTLKGVLRDAGKYPALPITTACRPFELKGAQITVLSPDTTQYNRAISCIEKKATEIASAGNDYDYPIEYFNNAIKQESEEDDSPANGSSIAILFSLSGRNIMLTGDAYPSVISKSIRDLGYNESENPLRLECMKLSHHASKGNISNNLLSMIRTTKFVVSANAANTHNLPNKEALARILLNGQRGSDEYFEFFFTHRNDLLETMFKVDGPEVFKKWRFHLRFPESGANSIYIR